MERIEAKIAFFIDKKRTRMSDGTVLPREVTAVFTDSGNYQYKDCYAHVGQHSTCGVDWIAENCRPAHYAEYKSLYDELNGSVGYDLEVIDGEWWLKVAMRGVKERRDYYSNGRAA